MWEPADGEDGRLAPKITTLQGFLGCQVLFIDRHRKVRRLKKPLILQNISQNGKPGQDLLISSFLPAMGGQGSEQRKF